MPETPTLTNHFLVRSEHLNHHGNLFGGDIMAEIDTAAYCLLRKAFPAAQFVTRASTFSFENPARIGEIVRFEASIDKVGTTSVAVGVVGGIGERVIARAQVVYVSIGPDGRKTPVRGSGGIGNWQ